MWPAAVDATFLKKGSSAGRGKGGTKNETEHSAGTTKKRNRQGHLGSAPGTGPGRMDQWPPPILSPDRGGVVSTQHSFGFLFNKTQKDMDFSPRSHQD